jgi:cell division protease FtsH
MAEEKKIGIPRGMAMGVTKPLPQEARHFYPRTYLMNKLSVALARRVAEKIVSNDSSSGALTDMMYFNNLFTEEISHDERAK